MVSLSSFLFAGGKQEEPKEQTAVEDTSSFNWRQFEGTEINVLGRQWFKDRWPWNEFEKKTGIKVVIDAMGYRQNYQKQMIEFGAKSDLYDLAVSQTEIVNIAYEKAGWFEILDPYLSKETIPGWSIDQFIGPAVDHNRTNGKLLGIPILTETPLIFYRTDLFEANGLKIPQSFEELETVAEKLTDLSPKKGYPTYGFVARGYQLMPSFSPYLYNMGGAVVDEVNYKVLFDSPEGLKAAKYYVNMLLKYGPPGIAGSDHEGARPIFEQGRAGMYSDTGALYDRIANPKNSLVADRISAFEPPPGSAGQKPFLSGWNISISAFSKKKDAAWLTIQWLTSVDVMKDVTMRTGHINPTKAIFNDPDYLKKVEPGWAKAFLSGMEKSKSGRMRPLLLRSREIVDIISAAISKSLEGANLENEWKKAARDAQKSLDDQKAELDKM
jgi:multiple sugar transport system substrate-binding protein